MRLPKPICENLLFLLAETSSQVSKLQVLLETFSPTVAQGILDRRGYAYNLKMRIHDGCLQVVHKTKSKDALDSQSLRAAEAIASEFERMTDLVHDCVRQMTGQKKQAEFKSIGTTGILDEVQQGIQLTKIGLEEDDTKTAVEVGEVAKRIQLEYQTYSEEATKRIGRVKRSQDVISALFVAHRLSEMADVLLGISEAILSARLGHPLHMDRFRFLETAIEDLGLENEEVEVEQLAETKSGTGVSGIGNGDTEGYVAIFKDGEKKKLKEERENVEIWHEKFPGLAPQILSYRKRGPNASLLIEHLPGFTFEQVVLTGSDELLANTIKHLTKTLKAVWRETKRSKKVPAQHMSQLRKRLGSVRKIHPDFLRSSGTICCEPTLSVDELIDAAEVVEQEMQPPFSVYIHGDFNLDNIIFDHQEKRINFIDLHRSCYSDYVQDVSVFMVSNYRLQGLDAQTRLRIKQVAVAFYEFAAKFADRNQDSTFDQRLAFGLARSFITSTRFILDRSHAKAMYLRGCYILERILDHQENGEKDFRLRVEELFA